MQVQEGDSLLEVVRITVVELEQAAGSVLQHHSWWLFFSCEGQKTRPSKNGVWHEVLTVSAGHKNVLVVSLFAWGRIKHELVGTVELSVENIKTLVLAGEETNALQRQCDFWFDCKSSQTSVASVRLAFELSMTPTHLKERMRAMLRPLIGVPVSQELVSFAAVAGRPACHESLDDREDDGSETSSEDSVVSECQCLGNCTWLTNRAADLTVEQLNGAMFLLRIRL